MSNTTNQGGFCKTVCWLIGAGAGAYGAYALVNDYGREQVQSAVIGIVIMLLTGLILRRILCRSSRKAVPDRIDIAPVRTPASAGDSGKSAGQGARPRKAENNAPPAGSSADVVARIRAELDADDSAPDSTPEAEKKPAPESPAPELTPRTGDEKPSRPHSAGPDAAALDRKLSAEVNKAADAAVTADRLEMNGADGADDGDERQETPLDRASPILFGEKADVAPAGAETPLKDTAESAPAQPPASHSTPEEPAQAIPPQEAAPETPAQPDETPEETSTETPTETPTEPPVETPGVEVASADAPIRAETKPAKAAIKPIKPKAGDAPEDGQGDDFSQLDDLGAEAIAALHAAGIYRFSQFTAMNRRELAWIDENIATRGGAAPRAESWRKQAIALERKKS